MKRNIPVKCFRGFRPIVFRKYYLWPLLSLFLELSKFWSPQEKRSLPAGAGLGLVFPQRQAVAFLKVFCKDTGVQRGHTSWQGVICSGLWAHCLELTLAKGFPLSESSGESGKTWAWKASEAKAI